MFGEMIQLSKFRASGCRCEDLVLLLTYVQMLNGKILKTLFITKHV